MSIVVDPGYETTLANSLATEIPTSSEMQAALKAELTGDPTEQGYSGKTPAEILRMLAESYQTPNPEPQGTVQLEQVTLADLQRWTSNRLAEITVSRPELAGKWAVLAAGFLVAQVPGDPILSSSTKLAGIAAGLEADGIDPKLDELFTAPDPAYSPTLYHPARIRVIWPGFLPTLADIEEALR